MADIRFKVQDAFINDLRKLLKLDTNTEVVQDALTLLKWAADERKRGRLVVSSDSQGENPVRLALRSLDRIED